MMSANPISETGTSTRSSEDEILTTLQRATLENREEEEIFQVLCLHFLSDFLNFHRVQPGATVGCKLAFG
jgi:hypothetical protein